LNFREWDVPGRFALKPLAAFWPDVLFILCVAGLFFGLSGFEKQITAHFRPAFEIDLSPLALPKYALYSLARGLIAYVISLVFTLLYGYWAAKDERAGVILIPLLDILQSIPVLGFMPGLVLALIAMFPQSNIGLELASVIMIFTGQAWNMTFSFYHSLRSLPPEQGEAAAVFRFNWWQKLRWVELPASATGLVWNSMMSMAGGWFFLMVSEAFVLGEKDYRLPGVGSYMSVAVEKGDYWAMAWALLAMTLMIVALDQLIWRPLAVWVRQYRLEDSAGETEAESSWFLEWLTKLKMVKGMEEGLQRFMLYTSKRQRLSSNNIAQGAGMRWLLGGVRGLLFLSVIAILLYAAGKLTALVAGLSLANWETVCYSTFLTFVRVFVVLSLSTLWTLPLGVLIGSSPSALRVMRPLVQIAASFPAPMLFPLMVALFVWFHLSLGWGSILLMTLGSQWYILFNVIGAAAAVPADLKEAAVSFRITGWRRFTALYAPAVFPALITGWVTAAGGAWNASIVAERVNYNGHPLATDGIGALISLSAEKGDFHMLAAGIMVMAAVVVFLNRVLWSRLYELAHRRYSLGG